MSGDFPRNRNAPICSQRSVVQLKDALNTVWEVQEQPGQGVWQFMRSYVVSLAAVLGLGFLLLVSLVVTAGLAAVGKYAAPYMQEWNELRELPAGLEAGQRSRLSRDEV